MSETEILQEKIREQNLLLEQCHKLLINCPATPEIRLMLCVLGKKNIGLKSMIIKKEGTSNG